MSTIINTVESIGWDEAIKDAKKHIARLQTVIATCEEKKAKGEPWPGSVKTAETDTKSVPA